MLTRARGAIVRHTRTMVRRIASLFLALLLAASCGGSAVTIDSSGDPDGGASVGDAAPSDATVSDGSKSDGSSVGDGATSSDATADAVACADCQPDFCGCGQCNPDQVVCTKKPIACPLGCATACDLSQFKCGCQADRCVRISPPSGSVIPCYESGDCPVGYCCQPRSALQGACVKGSGC